MAYPKMKPCPECKDTVGLSVFTYDNGWRHVECVKCDYLGPGCGSILSAIRHHNKECADQSSAALQQQEEGK